MVRLYRRQPPGPRILFRPGLAPTLPGGEGLPIARGTDGIATRRKMPPAPGKESHLLVLPHRTRSLAASAVW